MSFRDETQAFYGSPAWKECRASYMKSKQYLCERCAQKGIQVPAVAVHHKIHLSPSNINDPTITLSWSNLMAVCERCHSELHRGENKRYIVDEMGRVTILE